MFRKRKTRPRAFSFDDLNAEDLILNEKLARQLRTPLSKVVKKKGEFPLFDHFLVFGKLHQGNDTSMKCIFKYPHNKTVNIPSLEKFCFPSNFPIKFNRKQSDNIVEHIHRNTQNSYILLLTSETHESFYAICVIDDYLKEPPSFIQTNSEYNGIKMQNTLKCYCIVSRYPFFELFLEILVHILDTEEKSLKLPLNDRLNELNQTHRILEYIYPIKPPSPGRKLDLGLPNVSPFIRPKNIEEDKEILEFCVATLFQSLDREKILSLISLVLLERKLIFHSNNMRKLSNCIMSFVPLIKPFSIQCVFIPIVPEDIYDIMHAPVPFIAGITDRNQLKEIKEEIDDAVIVELDRHKIYIPDKVPLIHLPSFKKLHKKVEGPYNKLKKQFKDPIPFSPSKEEKEYASAMLEIINGFLTNMFSNFRKHCITSLTDNVTVFVKESFLNDETKNSEELKFFQEFFDTQIFSIHCEQRLKDIDEKRLEDNLKND